MTFRKSNGQYVSCLQWFLLLLLLWGSTGLVNLVNFRIFLRLLGNLFPKAKGKIQPSIECFNSEDIATQYTLIVSCDVKNLWKIFIQRTPHGGKSIKLMEPIESAHWRGHISFYDNYNYPFIKNCTPRI